MYILSFAHVSILKVHVMRTQTKFTHEYFHFQTINWMQNLVLDCKIMFVTSLIMLVGTETDVIVVEMGFTAPQQFSDHMECSGLS